jgi:hypothetical protein
MHEEGNKLRETGQSDFIKRFNITMGIIVGTSACDVIIC